MKYFLFCTLLALHPGLFAQANPSSSDEDYTFSPLEPDFWDFPEDQIVNDLEELAKMTTADFRNHPEYGTVPYRTQCEDCIEILDQRTVDSRYFAKSGTEGQTFYVQQIYGELHYEDDAGWLRTIDHRLRPGTQPGRFEAPLQPVPTRYEHSSDLSSITVGDYELAYNGVLHLYTEDANGIRSAATPLNKSQFSAGADGILTTNAWSGIDREQIFRQGEIKTNFLIQQDLALPANARWLVFEDRIEIPVGLHLKRDAFSGASTSEGLWMGDLLLVDANDQEVFRFKRPVMTDANPLKYGRTDLITDFTRTYIAYDHHQDQNELILRVKVDAEWLSHPGRVFPILVDPLVTGSSTFSAGIMGFRYDAACWNPASPCGFNMTVNVPGNSTLTDAYLDAAYVSEVFGCGIFLDCWMSEASFRVAGPCGNSPPVPFYWTCGSPTGDNAGTCSGSGNPAFSTVSCIPPQCANYSLTFQMRNYYCFCSSTGCAGSIGCQSMPNNSWIMTVEARTIQSTSQADATPVTLNGNCFTAHTIDANPSFGVPAYGYNWSSGPTPNSQTQSVTHNLNGTYSYSCTVTDACGQTSVSTVDIVILDCPLAVALDEFNGEALENANYLAWTTRDEIGFSHFDLERSRNSSDFDFLARIEKQAGEEGHGYEYEDKWPLRRGFYRLKMYDGTGGYTYSEVLELKRDKLPVQLEIRQDIGAGTLSMVWEGQSNERGEVVLISVTGKQISSWSFNEEAGQQMKMVLSTQKLSSGTYFLRWKGENHRFWLP